jgi:hypothetical protein
MSFKLRLIRVLGKLRNELDHLSYLANSCPLNSPEHWETCKDIMKLSDLECRLINKLNRL